MKPYLVVEIHHQKQYVTSRSREQFVSTPQDFLDLLAWDDCNGTNLYLLADTNFGPEFYDLTSGLAGEILQKVSNYGVRLAIFGSFDVVVSKRFRELMAESNKGQRVYFAQNKDDALRWLTQ